MIEIPVLHCCMDPCLNRQWWRSRENGPDCSIFSNEAIRRAVWMEIRLSFTAPWGNEWGRENQREQWTQSYLHLNWFLLAQKHQSSCENWLEQEATFDIDKLWGSTSPKRVNMNTIWLPMQPDCSTWNRLARGEGFRPDCVLWGVCFYCKVSLSSTW